MVVHFCVRTGRMGLEKFNTLQSLSDCQRIESNRMTATIRLWVSVKKYFVNHQPTFVLLRVPEFRKLRERFGNKLVTGEP